MLELGTYLTIGAPLLGVLRACLDLLHAGGGVLEAGVGVLRAGFGLRDRRRGLLRPGLALVQGWRRMQGFVFRAGDTRFAGKSAEQAARSPQAWSRTLVWSARLS